MVDHRPNLNVEDTFLAQNSHTAPCKTHHAFFEAHLFPANFLSPNNVPRLEELTFCKKIMFLF